MLKPCQSEYKNGDHIAEPSHTSQYQIRNVYSDSADYPDCLQRIGEHCVHNGLQNRIEIRHCMSDDADWWVRWLPGYLCKSLSRDIQPAVQELVNDGVPAATVQKIERWLSLKARSFVVQADVAREDADTNWGTTARCLEQRTGSVYQLAERFLDIVERVMEKAGIHVCSSCGLTECGRVMGTQKECI